MALEHPCYLFYEHNYVQICGVSLCCFNVLLLPLDVANHSGQARAVGGLPMEEISGYLYFITVIMASLIVPFTMFYYEAGDEKDDYEDP